MTITVREKGKKLEESGGLVLTSDMWLAPKIAAMKEVAEFDARYAKALYGSMIAGVSAEQMGMALAHVPDDEGRHREDERRGREDRRHRHPDHDDHRGREVGRADGGRGEESQSQDDDKASPAGGVSGALGGFAKRAMKKKPEGEPQARSTIFTSTHEVLKVATDVAAADVAVPAGFKESK